MCGDEAVSGARCGTLWVTVIGCDVEVGDTVGLETALQKTMLLLPSMVEEASNFVTGWEFDGVTGLSFISAVLV